MDIVCIDHAENSVPCFTGEQTWHVFSFVVSETCFCVPIFSPLFFLFFLPSFFFSFSPFSLSSFSNICSRWGKNYRYFHPVLGGANAVGDSLRPGDRGAASQRRTALSLRAVPTTGLRVLALCSRPSTAIGARFRVRVPAGGPDPVRRSAWATTRRHAGVSPAPPERARRPGLVGLHAWCANCVPTLATHRPEFFQ